MTPGHKHREVRVRRDGLRHGFLTRPRWHSTDGVKVDRSPYPYGPCTDPIHEERECWYLSILSVLHRWTGLTLRLDDDR